MNAPLPAVHTPPASATQYAHLPPANARNPLHMSPAGALSHLDALEEETIFLLREVAAD